MFDYQTATRNLNYGIKYGLPAAALVSSMARRTINARSGVTRTRTRPITGSRSSNSYSTASRLRDRIRRRRVSSRSYTVSGDSLRTRRLALPAPGDRRFGRKVYVTTGKVGSAFGKAARAKYDKFVKEGAVIKQEFGSKIEDQECVYVGHYTYPLNRVISCAMYALARRIMMMMNLYTQDPLEESFYIHALDVFVDYRDTVGGELKFSAATVVGSNFSQVELGDRIGTRIATLYTTSYLEIVRLRIVDTSTTETVFQCNGSNIFFEVVGNSNMQLQNRTLANNTTEPERYNANDVTNNPLRGKMYGGVSNKHMLKFIENLSTPGPIASFYYNNDTGTLGIASKDASFLPAVQLQLKKPPLAAAFSNLMTSKYIKLDPGEIRRSNTKASFKMGLNALIATFGEAIRGSSSMYSLQNAMIMKGKNVMFAFEKLCDTGGTDENAGISLGYECVTTLSSICYIKKKVNMNPLNLPI